MKLRLLSFIIFLVSILPVMAGDGSSAQSPLTVSQALVKKNDQKSYYVSGYIVGEYRDYSNNKHFYYLAPPFDGTSAYLIADDVDEMDLSRMMTVQIKDYVDNYNLDENPQYWRKQLTVKGTLTDYFTLPGIKNLTDWIAPAEPLDDESHYWNFYETFETKKAYISAGEQMYSGGTYTSSETCRWEFTGATYGDSSNDMKWDNAAAHLRLTQSTSGEPGYICMLDDKPDGIGYIRLWAARYKEDKGAASFGIFLSNDQGENWETIQTDIAIEKELTEYQFKIMRPGTWRIKIAKTDPSANGIDIDNIHISDYYTPSAVTATSTEATTRLWGTQGTLCFEASQPVNLRIHTLDGTLVSEQHIAGHGSLPLPAGFYLVSTPTSTVKVVVR